VYTTADSLYNKNLHFLSRKLIGHVLCSTLYHVLQVEVFDSWLADCISVSLMVRLCVKCDSVHFKALADASNVHHMLVYGCENAKLGTFM